MSSTKMIGWLMGVSLASLPASAWAQTYQPAPNPEYAPGVTRGPRTATSYGSEVALGGGVMNFTGAAAREVTGVAGNWNLRVALGTRSVIGVELAYVGSLQGISSPGLDPRADLLGNGAEAALRVNLPLASETNLIEPFLLGGIGWTHFNVINDSVNNSLVGEKDNVGTVPLAAGLAGSTHGFMVDARFTYRLTFDNQLLGGNNLNSWAVTANVGREF
jgi:hypothetical protein